MPKIVLRLYFKFSYINSSIIRVLAKKTNARVGERIRAEVPYFQKTPRHFEDYQKVGT